MRFLRFWQNVLFYLRWLVHVSILSLLFKLYTYSTKNHMKQSVSLYGSKKKIPYLALVSDNIMISDNIMLRPS